MSEKIRLDRKIGFRNTFCTKCINVIIDSIGPSIILRSILLVHYARSLKLDYSHYNVMYAYITMINLLHTYLS